MRNQSFVIYLYGSEDLNVEKVCGQAKGDLFQAAFGIKLDLQIVPPTEIISLTA